MMFDGKAMLMCVLLATQAFVCRAASVPRSNSGDLFEGIGGVNSGRYQCWVNNCLMAHAAGTPHGLRQCLEERCGAGAIGADGPEAIQTPTGGRMLARSAEEDEQLDAIGRQLQSDGNPGYPETVTAAEQDDDGPRRVVGPLGDCDTVCGQAPSDRRPACLQHCRRSAATTEPSRRMTQLTCETACKLLNRVAPEECARLYCYAQLPGGSGDEWSAMSGSSSGDQGSTMDEDDEKDEEKRWGNRLRYAKRWGNRVGRRNSAARNSFAAALEEETWKRWGSRVCVEAHCRSLAGDRKAFVACGQSRCGRRR